MHASILGPPLIAFLFIITFPPSMALEQRGLCTDNVTSNLVYVVSFQNLRTKSNSHACVHDTFQDSSAYLYMYSCNLIRFRISEQQIQPCIDIIPACICISQESICLLFNNQSDFTPLQLDLIQPIISLQYTHINSSSQKLHWAVGLVIIICLDG